MRAINLEVNYDGVFRRTPYLRQGETGTSTIYLALPTEFQGYSYIIVFQPVTGDPISTEELTPDSDNIISYVLTSVFTAEVGTIGVELNCYDESDNLVKSAEMSIEVKESLTGAGDVMPTDYVPWYVLAAQKASEAEEDAAQTALDRVATGEDVVATGEDVVQTGKDRVQTGEDRIATGQDRVATGEDRSAVNSALSTFSTVTLPAAVAEVEAEGDAQILLVQGEGTTQKGLVTAEGATQVNRVIAEGDTQEQRVTGEGTTQVGLVQAEGITQIGLVEDAGDAQILLVQGEGTTQIGLVEDAGTAQIALVQAQLPNVQANIGELQAEMSQVESTLNQLNPNGDAKITVTSFDTVNSLPKNAAQAGLGVVQEGMTATKLVTNGDFSNGTTGWGTSGANLGVTDKILSIIGSGSDAFPSAYQDTLLDAKSGDKLYFSALARVTNAVVLSIRAVFYGLTAAGTTQTLKDIPTPTQNQWYSLSGIGTVPADMVGKIRIAIRHRYADAETANGKVMEVDVDFGVKVVNLTAIAKEAATLSQADAMLLDYFSGTQSAVTGRVRSVGKNMCPTEPTEWEQGTLVSATGQPSASTVFLRTKSFLPKKQLTAYVFSLASGYGLANIYLYDSNKTFLGRTNSANVSNTSNSFFYKVVIEKAPSATVVPSDVLAIKPQLELGSTATTYESYRKTESYTKPMALRRVPNNTTDDVTNGKHTKRVSEWANVSGATFNSIDNATYTNVSVVKTTAFALATAGTTAIDNSIIYRDKNGVVLAEVASADIDSLASIGKFYYHTDKTVWRILAKGSLSIADARTALGTETMIYQLETPIITENVSSGTLLAYPSGTVYWEPVVADVAIYASGASILNTGYPISTLESIYKIDLVTGEQTPLAVASATVASGGLSFTHTGLSNGDLVGFTYYFSHPYPYGENDYTYINSNAVVLGADGVYYKIGFAVDIAGTISLTKTAVT